MEIQTLLNASIQDFIIENSELYNSKLAFQKNPFPDIDYRLILSQIEGRSKSKLKLPTWFNAKNIIYPSKISIEQTSSEITALYKSQLIDGENLIDLSGGFGVDDYYFSKVVNTVIHCEINTELSQIVAHNFNQLSVANVKCIAADSKDTLLQLNQKFSWIYIDPSRRNDQKGKVFLLKDCLPNVPEELDFYYNYSNNILIKTAPLLDLKSGLLELKNVKNIHIIAVENEVKELLWEIEKDFSNSVALKTINFTKEVNQIFDFVLNNESIASYSLPKKYLYEPNSAIMKSGGFSAIGNHYNLDKLHQNSHLYTSDEVIEFPGRVFEIQQLLPYSKKEMKANFENLKTNITIRNFPDTVENLKKKWKIKDGGPTYCFFTTDKNDNKIVLICTKIKIK